MQAKTDVMSSAESQPSLRTGQDQDVTIRINHFEFWPAWTIHFPMYLLGIFWGIRLGNLNFFPAVNSGMANGGLFNYSKYESMRDFAEKNVPKSIRSTPPHLAFSVLEKANQRQIFFPMILKPDIGERGRGVKLIANTHALENYLTRFQSESVIVQEFISKKEEYGVFVIKNPKTGTLQVTSVTQKIPLQVLGNGKDSVRTLVENHPRASRYPLEISPELWEIVPEKGLTYRLSMKGNHCKGAQFLDRSDLINPNVSAAFEKICQPLQGFHYGRLDVKVDAASDLENPTKITVLEVNGANSEPIHIYSPGNSYFKSLLTISDYFAEMAKIARFRLKFLSPKPRISDLYSSFQTYKRLKKETHE
jgi:hypothetical protein